MAEYIDIKQLQSKESMQEISSLHLEEVEEYNFDPRRLVPEVVPTTIEPSYHQLNSSVRSIILNKMLSMEYLGNIFDVVGAHTENGDIRKAGILEMAPKSNGPTMVIDASFNTTDSSTMPELFYRHSMTMTVVYCVAYFFVFAVGLIGNFFVIAVVFRSPRMRTVTNFFIVNLAVADILVIVFCLPATLMSNIFVRE